MQTTSHPSVCGLDRRGRLPGPAHTSPLATCYISGTLRPAHSRCQAPGLALEGCPRAVWVDVLRVLEGQARRPVGDARGQGRGRLGVTVTGH